jgi:hypothetical protein
MGEVLSRLDLDSLSDPSIRSPAAFAEYLVQGMAARLPVTNRGREAGVLPAAVVGPGVPAEDAAAVRGPAAVPPTAQERAAATLLQRALPDEVWQRVPRRTRP